MSPTVTGFHRDVVIEASRENVADHIKVAPIMWLAN
jgi:hypothetical protein